MWEEYSRVVSEKKNREAGEIFDAIQTRLINEDLPTARGEITLDIDFETPRMKWQVLYIGKRPSLLTKLGVDYVPRQPSIHLSRKEKTSWLPKKEGNKKLNGHPK